MTEMEVESGNKPVAEGTETPAAEKTKRMRKRDRQRAGKAAAKVKKEKEAVQQKEEQQKKEQKEQAKPPVKKKVNKRGSGCVFIKHLPKGFNEEELRQFFEQFGEVMQVCVARARETQQSKGYGYVQFRYFEVAEIAAKAVDNFMLFGRVLKTSVLPKRMLNIPRNFGKAYTSKGEQTEAYQRWLKRKVKQANSQLGSQRLSERCSKHMGRLMRAEKELSEAGITLPEMENCLAKLKEKSSELRQTRKHDLANMPPPKEKAKKQAPGAENDCKNSDDEDEDVAFTPLQPSDWKEVEPVAENETKGSTVEAKKTALKKAQEKKKQFEAEKGALTGKTIGKENKKATPAKKQPKKAKLPLSQKKEKPSEVSVSPAGKKAKRALAVKDAKSAKVGKKVK